MSDRETALFVALDAAFDVSLVQDPTTPQGAAFDWLLNTDVETDPCDTLQITQRYALAVLYESTGGIDWAVDDGWLSASPVCDWFEVDCADNETTIIQLTLFDNNLNGTLPEELAALKSLRNFNVFFNSLRGTIPDYFSAWPELILFDVENNTLSGEPFAWLDDSQRLNDDTGMLMPNLRFFRLSHNQFQGSITTNVARQLSSIQQLWIAGNKFTGQVPNEIGIFTEMRKPKDRCASVISSNVSIYLLIDVVLFCSTFAEDLFLYNNLFTGTIPDVLRNLDLSRLQIQNNGFNGTLPVSLFSNSNMRELRLDGNNFRGTLSSLVGNINVLQDFRISSNNFEGTLPNTLAALTNLRKYLM